MQLNTAILLDICTFEYCQNCESIFPSQQAAVTKLVGPNYSAGIPRTQPTG